jgi:large repetitive protein
VKKLFTILVLVVSAATLIAAVSKAPQVKLSNGSIFGIITDSVTGLPISGARVVAGRCQLQATTNNDGSYTIANVPPGDYTVRAMKCNEYAPKEYPAPVHVESGQQVTGINIALAPMGGGGGGNGSISGTVYDKRTNTPIVGAKVTAGGCHNSAMTGNDGTYTITGLAYGSYTVKACKDGYECATYPAQVVISGGNSVSGINFYLVPKQADSFK